MDSEAPIVTRVTHAGVVQSVADGRAVIAVEAQGCSACGKRSACGVGKLANGRPILLEVPVAEALAPGEAVTCEISERHLLSAALRGYLRPAVLLVFGAGMGEAYGDAAAALGALLGLLAGLALTRRPRSSLAPVVLKR